MATLSDEMDETYTATDSLGIIIGKTAPQVSALTELYIAQNMAATTLSPVMGALSDEMDEAYTATNNLGIIVGASKGPAADLAAAVDTMKMRIEEAQKAADLNEAAFRLLTPELQAAAMEMGLFREEIVEVGKTVATTAMGLGNAARSIGSTSRQRSSGGTQTTGLAFDENGNLIASESFGGDEGGPASSSSQQVFANTQGDLFFDPEFVNRADDAFQELHDSMDITTMAVDNLDNALTGNTLVNSLDAVDRAGRDWESGLNNIQANIGTRLMPKVSDLDALLAETTERIKDTAAATELQEMALAALSPELLTLSEEFGLFGLRVTQTANDVADASAMIGTTARPRERRGANQNSDQVALLREIREAIAAGAPQAYLDAIRESYNRDVRIQLDGSTIFAATTRAESEGSR